MKIGEKLRELRERSNLSVKEVVNELKKHGITIAEKTLYGYESDKNQTNADMFLALCKIYNCKNILKEFSDSTDDVLFTNDEWNLVEKYRSLDDFGRETLSVLLDREIDRVGQINELKESPTAIIEIFPTRKYLQSASAGYGDFNDDDSYEILELIKQPPLGTSFIVTVNGDSMEPTYLNGSLLFVKAQETIEIGQIGLFVKAGDLYIKELGENCLISHNKNYPAIYPEPDAPILTQGKIIGVCSEDYLPQ